MTTIKYIVRELSDDGLLKPVERHVRYSGWEPVFARAYSTQEQALAAITESPYIGDFVILPMASRLETGDA